MKNQMVTTPTYLASLLVFLMLSLTACKKPGAGLHAANQHADLAVSASAPVLAAAMSRKVLLANSGTRSPVEKSFDFDSIPEANGSIPPFPYVTIPPRVPEGFQSTVTVPMDEIALILGDRLHTVEGRVCTRTFHNKAAEMSKLEIHRNYEDAIRAMGAVKINIVSPENPVLNSEGRDDFIKRTERLSMPDLDMTYDVYLARKGTARYWLVVMVGSKQTRLIVVEEQPFKQTIDYVGENGKPWAVTATGAPLVAPQPIDIAALPISSTTLPPFPYLPYPPGLNEAMQRTQQANFDSVQIIVGKQVREVEGRFETRSFANRNVNMSEMALRRNYEAAVKGLGGIKVNAVGPDDPALVANRGNGPAPEHDKMRFPGGSLSYDSYLIRTPEKNIWLVLMFSDSKTSLLAVEEKAMQQSVGLVTADAMSKELANKGKIALYINFDTDKATLRPDGKPAIDEVTKLLKADPQLRLAIEGHTDDSGNAAHNQALSGQRAEAVVQTLVKDGIDAKRLRAAGRGAAMPLADNKDEAGRATNRRVELIKL